ncbi:hypothetical protein [uncultured Veillonella sp.]|uniref:hypothetical protein n=1 Tax=uncultured Veillonella sp. TaxID=159268 RepID=UPI0025DF13CF|nr:hypothetical protein [uncultured Veillonella sp.]
MIITPLTTLEAVNEILASIGEAPVDTVEETGNVDVENALQMLNRVSRQVQQDGYTFNTIENYELQPDRFTKEIAWNNQMLRVISTDNSYLRNRDGIVYDVTNNTDKFDGTLTAQVVMLVNFEELPSVFREFITVRSARLFTSRYLGDELLLKELLEEEQRAQRRVFEYELALEKPTIASNTDVSDTIRRS